MDSGAFDRRVTLQRLSETDDGYGTVADSWADIATVWAQLLPVSRMVLERLAASENQSAGPVLFRIRRDSAWADLNAKDRLHVERSRARHHVRSDGRARVHADRRGCPWRLVSGGFKELDRALGELPKATAKNVAEANPDERRHSRLRTGRNPLLRSCRASSRDPLSKERA
jgi:SPP1 family predicted phage head-tail adaptor